MKPIRALFAAVAALTLAVAQPARAADPAGLVVLEGWRGTDGVHMAGLSIRLAPGWKTYWRTPGDAGIPPVLTWDGSRNLAAAGIAFPVPEVLDQNGVRSIGYSSDVMLPLRVRPVTSGEDIHLSGTLSIGVCHDICIPVELPVKATLRAAVTAPDAAILAAVADRPMTRAEGDVGGVSCEAEPIRDGLRLTATVDMPALGRGEVVVIEYADRAVWISEADAQRKGRRLVAVADMVPPESAPFLMSRDAIRLTILAGGRAVEIDGCS